MIVAAGNSAWSFRVVSSVNDAFSRLANISIKLATGRRILNGSDDPAGLIAMSSLSNELTAVEQVAAAAEHIRSFVHTADGAMASASNLISQVRSLTIAAANDTLTPDQRDALQAEADAALDAINRLGDTTYGGQSIFNGDAHQFLTGPDPSDTTSLVLPVMDDSLGGSSGQLVDLRSGGSANLVSGDLESAVSILDQAQNQIISSRAAAGAFERYALDSTRRLMDDAQVSLAFGLVAIGDIDVASAVSHLVREKTLAAISMSVAQLTLGSQRAIDRLLGKGAN